MLVVVKIERQFSFYVMDDMFLFDVTYQPNFEKLRKEFKSSKLRQYPGHQRVMIDRDIPEYMDGDLMKCAFDDGLKRYSYPAFDDATMYWFCRNLNLDGWGYVPKTGKSWLKLLFVIRRIRCVSYLLFLLPIR